jgi:TDG/mug DNA glycosylase family protein
VKAVPDVVGPGLQGLFVGINPSLASAEAGHHFARPGNRFWAVLHRAGFTPRLLSPTEDGLLPKYGWGVPEEYATGARDLERRVRRWRPRVVAMVGLDAWRRAFGGRRDGVGLQERKVGDRPVWVLPNPSGLNASYQAPELVRLYAELRAWVTTETR